ncbi:DNA translocase FtsK [Pseudomonadota bacterium]
MGRKKGRRKAPFKLQLKRDTFLSLVSLFLWFIAGIIIVSFSDEGVILQQIQLQLQETFGFVTLVLPFIFISGGLMISQVNWKVAKPNVFFGSIIFFVGVLGLFQGGSSGSGIFTNLSVMIHPAGAALLLLSIAIAGLLIMLETAIAEVLVSLSKILSKLTRLPKLPSRSIKSPDGRGEMKITGVGADTTEKEAIKDKETGDKTDDKSTKTSKLSDKPSTLITSAPDENIVWEKPPLSLLSSSSGGKADRGDLKQNAAIIEQVLESFGIKARVIEVNCGPAVTQYALEISLGTKLSKITALQNDLALALAAPTGQIRIEAPIPGRSLVGIEIPNRSPEFVTLRTMLTSRVLKKEKSKLAVSLGLNVSGEAVIADITKMPHILIAGATGSGKSVCLNSFLTTILFRASPDEVKFILVDPKRVELTGYNDIPHLLTPVIIEPEKVLSALKWAINEMQGRYKLFSEVGVRNIDSYNELSGFQALPYIVIVIDELADIMLFSPGEVEEAVTKLAQMARATGIHLVLATQRPSVDVITGLIKANIPCRLAFNVTSMVDSRVIIDGPGAEKLLGRGDMLYIPPSQSKPTRIQGTFVSEEETQHLISFLKGSGVQPQYTEEVTTKYTPMVVKGGSGKVLEDVDDLFEQAVQTVIQYNRASASLLQRSLSIGYARAARVIDQLEQAGVVSASDGSSKPRDVLIKSAQDFFSKQGN